MSCQEAIFHCPLCGRHLTAYVNLTHDEVTEAIRKIILDVHMDVAHKEQSHER